MFRKKIINLAKHKLFTNAMDTSFFSFGKSWFSSNKSIRDSLGNDFFIKSIRTDVNDFFRSISIYQLTRSPSQQIKSQLRKGPKKKYTVTGEGVFLREEKIPQYTHDEKMLYSQPQSFSLVTEDSSPEVFGFNKDRKENLIVVALHKKDVLLSKRLYIYDGGTINRPYDFDTIEEAENYFKHKVKSEHPVLFSDFEEFKKAVNSSYRKSSYNEPIVRAKWNTDGTSYILIASDTLTARLLAQDRARILLNRLKEQSQELNIKWNIDYQVPMGFYLPGSDLHLKEYTYQDAANDLGKGYAVYSDTISRARYFQDRKYEILLSIDDPAINIIESIKGVPLIIKIINDGHKNIAYSLIEKSNPEILNSVQLTGLTPYLDFSRFDFGDFPLIKWLISKNLLQKDIFVDLAMHSDSVKMKNYIDHFEEFDINTQNQFGETALFNAIKMKNYPLIQLLLNSGIDTEIFSKNHVNALMLAVQIEDVVSLQLLLEHGANPNAITHSGRNIFTYLVNPEYHKNVYPEFFERVMSLLLDYGFIPDAEDIFGMTPLLYACQNGLIDLAKNMLAKSIDINNTNKNGSNALMVAVVYRQLSIVKLLVEYGVDINATDRSGNTALIYACSSNNIDIVKLLLENGAKFDIVNAKGQTALIISEKNPDIVNLIKRHSFLYNDYSQLSRFSLLKEGSRLMMESVKSTFKFK